MVGFFGFPLNINQQIQYFAKLANLVTCSLRVGTLFALHWFKGNLKDKHFTLLVYLVSSWWCFQNCTPVEWRNTWQVHFVQGSTVQGVKCMKADVIR